MMNSCIKSLSLSRPPPPLEVWSNIFSCLPPRHLKTLSFVSRFFREIARPLLWHEPETLKAFHYVDFLSKLRQLAALKLPIRQLSLAQFPFLNAGMFGTENIKQMVGILLDEFTTLQSFIIVQGPTPSVSNASGPPPNPVRPLGGSFNLSENQLRCLLLLPVTLIHTDSFLQSYIFPDLFLDLLADSQLRPRLVIGEEFHMNSRIADWRRMRDFPIVKIHAGYYDPCLEELENTLSACDYEEYCTIVNSIQPAPPKYSLRVTSLDSLQRVLTIQIDELTFDYEMPVSQFIECIELLEEHNQQPLVCALPDPDDLEDVEQVVNFVASQPVVNRTHRSIVDQMIKCCGELMDDSQRDRLERIS